MLSKSLLRFSSKAFKPLRISDKLILSQKSLNPNPVHIYGQPMTRFIWSERKHFRYELPPLMDFQPQDIGLPFITSLKIFFYLKPFVDKNFDLNSFLIGAKHVLNLLFIFYSI